MPLAPTQWGHKIQMNTRQEEDDATRDPGHHSANRLLRYKVRGASLSVTAFDDHRGPIMGVVRHAARSFPRIIGPFINYREMFIVGMIKEKIWTRDQALEVGDDDPEA
jgi:hypothetical protein